VEEYYQMVKFFKAGDHLTSSIFPHLEITADQALV
jgi:hypothetical protein